MNAVTLVQVILEQLNCSRGDERKLGWMDYKGSDREIMRLRIDDKNRVIITLVLLQ